MAAATANTAERIEAVLCVVREMIRRARKELRNELEALFREVEQ